MNKIQEDVKQDSKLCKAVDEVYDAGHRLPKIGDDSYEDGFTDALSYFAQEMKAKIKQRQENIKCTVSDNELKMNKQEVEKEVLRIVVEQMCMDTSIVDMNTTKEEMCADSLDEIEIIMALERYFEIEIEDAAAKRIRTVQDAANVVALIVGVMAPVGDTK